MIKRLVSFNSRWILKLFLLSLAFLTIQSGFAAEPFTKSIVAETIYYTIDGELYSGYIAYDKANNKPRPGILVVHEWWGANDYARKRAWDLAEEGYVAFAIDMYGAGKVTEHPDDAMGFVQETTANMAIAEQRFNAAMSLLSKDAKVRIDNIAAIGYCYGGGVVLHMARTGAPLKAVASFHGSLATEMLAEKGKVKAKIQVHNGADDPMVSAEQIAGFKQEMDSAKVDYTLVNYPNAKHSFTNREADSFGKANNMPLAYNAEADKQSWKSMLGLMSEVFSD